MTSQLTILALDISSRHIGVVFVRGPSVVLHTTWDLPGKIATQCHTARELVRTQIALLGDIDLIAIESPVAKFAKAVIPQARVSGAVLTALAEAGVAWVEIPPTRAKLALCGSGRASKAEMIAAAGLASEHEADALGLARAAQRMRIQKEAA